MEHIDREMERRVWGRVLAKPEAGLDALAAQALQRADAYERLSRVLPASRKQLLLQMVREERQSAAVLLDIHRTLTGRALTLRAAPWPRHQPRALLRRCADTSANALDAYTRRAGDAAHGTAFAGLAARQQAHCTALAQMPELK